MTDSDDRTCGRCKHGLLHDHNDWQLTNVKEQETEHIDNARKVRCADFTVNCAMIIALVGLAAFALYY